MAAQEDEDQADGPLQRRLEPGRDRELEPDDGDAGAQEGERVAGAPERAEEARPGEAALARDQRRDRRDVIGVEGVPETEGEAEAERGDQRDVHGGSSFSGVADRERQPPSAWTVITTPDTVITAAEVRGSQRRTSGPSTPVAAEARRQPPGVDDEEADRDQDGREPHAEGHDRGGARGRSGPSRRRSGAPPGPRGRARCLPTRRGPRAPAARPARRGRDDGDGGRARGRARARAPWACASSWSSGASAPVLVGVRMGGSGPSGRRRGAGRGGSRPGAAMRIPDAAPSHGYRRSGTTWREA